MKSLVAHTCLLDDDLVVAVGLHSLGAAILVPGFVPAPNLKAAFEKHRNQTKGHVERLQQVFETMGKRPQGKTCEAIRGIIAEGEEIMEEFKDMPAFDAGLISSAQRSRAIWMMIGIGTPSSHRRIERISCSFASVEIP
jgi:hypothetical protein